MAWDDELIFFFFLPFFRFFFSEIIRQRLEQIRYFHQRFIHPRLIHVIDRNILLVQSFALYFHSKREENNVYIWLILTESQKQCYCWCHILPVSENKWDKKINKCISYQLLFKITKLFVIHVPETFFKMFILGGQIWLSDIVL